MKFHSQFPIALCCLAFAACSGGSGTLTVTSSLVDAQPLTIGDGTLVIDSARIAVSAIEFEDEGFIDREASLDGAVIDINVDGDETVVAATNVDSGTYNVVGFEFATGGTGPEFADFNGVEPASLIVTGTYAGDAFTYRGTVIPEVEFALEPAVNVTNGGNASVSISVDLEAWFTDVDGSVLDPRDPGSQPAIDENILASLEASAVDFERDSSLDD
ncbi:MAG: hypothetical protein AAFQ82_11215 [Myxococcota bacterium]